jgi:hypothetical protein
VRSPFAAVIGAPIDHSLSPVIHRAAFAAADLEWTYAAFEVDRGGGQGALAAMRLLGISGLTIRVRGHDPGELSHACDGGDARRFGVLGNWASGGESRSKTRDGLGVDEFGDASDVAAQWNLLFV